MYVNEAIEIGATLSNRFLTLERCNIYELKGSVCYTVIPTKQM